MKRIVIIAVALLAAPFAQPAAAQGPAADRTQIVSYADLDLSREADVRELDRRIDRAVKQVCGIASDIDLEGKNEVRRCRTLTSASLAAERGRALASASRPSPVVLASGD